MHTPKRKNKTHNSPNMMPSLSCPLPVQCGSGRLSASLEPAPQGFSTSDLQAFSPRTVLTEDICRCVQHLRQHFPTTIPFPATPTITFSCLASAAHQADSWWLGHVETDDVVIADIGGQALDIFLHGPESAHKKGILKTFTHTSISIQPHTFPKKQNKNSTHQTWCLRLIVLFLSNVVVGDFQEDWLLLLRTCLRRRPSCLGQYWQKTFVDVFNTYANISWQQCPF